MIKVIEESQYKTQQIEGFRPMRVTSWQQYPGWANDEQPSAVAFCYVVALYSRQSKEIWICEITSSSPNELVVVSYFLYFYKMWYHAYKCFI